MKCYDDTANQAVCLQTASSKMFNIVNASISNPSLLTNLKNSSYKVSFMHSYFNELFLPPAFAENSLWNNVIYAFQTTDGSIYGYEKDAITLEGINVGFNTVTDINGLKKPNKAGSDFFRFEVDYEGTLTDITEKLISPSEDENTNNSNNSETTEDSGSTSNNENSNNSGETGNSNNSENNMPSSPDAPEPAATTPAAPAAEEEEGCSWCRPEPTNNASNNAYATDANGNEIEVEIRTPDNEMVDAVNEAKNNGDISTAFPEDVIDELPITPKEICEAFDLNINDYTGVQGDINLEIGTENNYEGQNIAIVAYNNETGEFNVFEAAGTESGNLTFTLPADFAEQAVNAGSITYFVLGE